MLVIYVPVDNLYTFDKNVALLEPEYKFDIDPFPHWNLANFFLRASRVDVLRKLVPVSSIPITWRCRGPALASLPPSPLEPRIIRTLRGTLHISLQRTFTPQSTQQQRCLLTRFSPGGILRHHIFSWPIPQHWAPAQGLRGLVLAWPTRNTRNQGHQSPGPPLLELTIDNSLLNVTLICIVVFCEDDAPASGGVLFQWVSAGQKRHIFHFSS
jgi:hypothetical protein